MNVVDLSPLGAAVNERLTDGVMFTHDFALRRRLKDIRIGLVAGLEATNRDARKHARIKRAIYALDHLHPDLRGGDAKA